jgi:hypothetical protein
VDAVLDRRTLDQQLSNRPDVQGRRGLEAKRLTWCSPWSYDAGASISLFTRPTTYWMSVTKTTKPAATYPTVGRRWKGQITHPA